MKKLKVSHEMKMKTFARIAGAPEPLTDPTREARLAVLSFLRAQASKGGKARAKKMSKAQRVTQAKKAVQARWAKKRGK